MATNKIQQTRNYSLFGRNVVENRPLDLKKHRKLSESMKLYGFLRCFPIVVTRNADNVLIVKDGQHRLAIAAEQSLPVWWIEEEVNFDVAIVNSTAKTWTLGDYARKHAANGLKDYEQGIEFVAAHHLPVGTAFALLAGTCSFNNVQAAFIDGSFRVKDRKWADDVAGVFGPLSTMAPALKSARFIEACMAACRVAEFDPKRFIANAERCREKLVSYSTRDAFLDMMEAVYNFGRVKLLGLKSAAIMAMRERNIVGKAKKKSA